MLVEIWRLPNVYCQTFALIFSFFVLFVRETNRFFVENITKKWVQSIRPMYFCNSVFCAPKSRLASDSIRSYVVAGSCDRFLYEAKGQGKTWMYDEDDVNKCTKRKRTTTEWIDRWFFCLPDNCVSANRYFWWDFLLYYFRDTSKKKSIL